MQSAYDVEKNNNNNNNEKKKKMRANEMQI